MDANTTLPALEQPDFIDLTADIVAAYVANNSVPVVELPTLVSGVHAALAGLGGATASPEPKANRPTPSQIRKSVTPDALISFLDGKPYKTLKRHLKGAGLTVEQYRERFGLPRDYPMTAASYSAMRSEFARSNRLGHQPRTAAAKTANTAEVVTEPPKARGRKKANEPAAKPSKGRKPRKGGLSGAK